MNFSKMNVAVFNTLEIGEDRSLSKCLNHKFFAFKVVFLRSFAFADVKLSVCFLILMQFEVIT